MWTLIVRPASREGIRTASSGQARRLGNTNRLITPAITFAKSLMRKFMLGGWVYVCSNNNLGAKGTEPLERGGAAIYSITSGKSFLDTLKRQGSNIGFLCQPIAEWKCAALPTQTRVS